MKIFLPGTLNLEEVVKRHPPAEVPKFNLDDFALILSQIINVKVLYPRLLDVEGFVPLHSGTLQGLNRQYRDYLDYAVKAGIIEENRYYVVDKRCRHFRFFPEHDSPIVPVAEFDTGLPLTKSNKPGIIDLPKKYRFLMHPFKSGLLEVDADNAKNFFENQYEYYLRKPDQIPFDHKTGKRKNPVDKYNSAIINIERIVEEDYFMSLDDSAGRLHTNMTNMPGLLRNFLKYNGQPLVSVDISNCQPYLVNGLLQPHFYDCAAKIFEKTDFGVLEGKFEEKEPDPHFNMTTVSTHMSGEWYKEVAVTSSPFMLVNLGQINATQEIQEFREITVSGMFYERFQYHLVRDLGNQYEDRDLAKLEALRALFTGNRYLHQHGAEAKKCFSMHYPNIYKLITHLKKSNKKFFPALLQAMEAEIMLNRVARRIRNQRRKIPVFTIHDCLLTTADNVEYVKQVIYEEFTRCIGAPPHLKLEYYGPGNRKLLKLPYYRP